MSRNKQLLDTTPRLVVVLDDTSDVHVYHVPEAVWQFYELWKYTKVEKAALPNEVLVDIESGKYPELSVAHVVEV